MQKEKQKRGWCPSLEKPMETGDGLLVRVPIKFGRLNSEIARKIAKFSELYGNGHLDLSLRGNLQFRGVSEKTYIPLREKLFQLGFTRDVLLHIITSPLAGIDPKCNEKILYIYDRLQAIPITNEDSASPRLPSRIFVRDGYIWQENNNKLPEKFLIVLDGGGDFPLADIPCDIYLKPEKNNEESDIEKILKIIRQTPKCNKKSIINKYILPTLGFLPISENFGVVMIAVPFGRIEARWLDSLAKIAEKYGKANIILAPKRLLILPDIAVNDAEIVIKEAKKIGFIVENDDSRLNIYACVGAPACSSANGNTRQYAEDYAKKHKKLDKIVHITGCEKFCAYKGKADILFLANGKKWIKTET